MHARLVFAVLLAAALLGASASARPPRHIIPWISTRPTAPAEPPLAPPCQANGLRASAFLQGATGNLAGAAIIRNVSGAPCSLLGRPGARFEGTAAAATAWKIVPAPAPSLDLSAVYDPPSSLRALAPGRAASVELFWSNWCAPGTPETTSGTPPDALVLVLPHGRGELSLPLHQAPRCDAPNAASTLSVTLFLRRGRYLPPSSHLPLQAAIFGVPIPQSKLVPPTLHARRGGLLHYMIALTNLSARPFRFRSCPIYVENLASPGRFRPEVHVLNCRPMGTLRPRARAIFAMVLHVPRDAFLPVDALSWELAPRTYLPPFAAGLEGRVLVAP